MTKYSILLNPDSGTYQISGGMKRPIEYIFDMITPVTPDLGLLPPVVRYISPWTDKGFALVIVEGMPHYRTIVFDDRAFKVPIPWTHTFIHLKASSITSMNPPQVESIGFCFSSKKMESIDHTFHPPYLPNVTSCYQMREGIVKLDWRIADDSIIAGYYVCPDPALSKTPSFTKKDVLGKNLSLADVYDQFMESYYGTQFGADAYDSLSDFVHINGGRHPKINCDDVSDHDICLDLLEELSKKTIEEVIDRLDHVLIDDRVCLRPFAFAPIDKFFTENAFSFTLDNFIAINTAMNSILEIANSIGKSSLQSMSSNVYDPSLFMSSNVDSPFLVSTTTNTFSISEPIEEDYYEEDSDGEDEYDEDS